MSRRLAIKTSTHRAHLSTTVPLEAPPFVLGSMEWGLIPARYLSDLAAQHPLRGFQDPLTGLSNRCAFNAILDGLIEQFEAASLILLDLDGFKDVNDTGGHDAGDALLQDVGHVLARCAGSHEVVTRLGGDEFAIILPGVSCIRELGRAAKRYCCAVRSELHGVQDAPVHASAGAALYPLHASNRSELMKCADIALYAAKNAGRDRATVFRPGLRSEVTRRCRMIERAVHCLQSDRLTVFFQPKQDLQTGLITGYEALLRCRDTKGSLKLPSWIAAAFENAGLASAIGQFVQDSALAFLRDLRMSGRSDGRVAINVTSFELRSPTWASSLVRRLRDETIPASTLQVEVNESVLLGRSARQMIRSLWTLHEAGVRISLDDFGTGFASLSHLRSCPIDELKIDRSFVSNLDDPDAQAIIRAIVDLGRSLQMGVVAEGVEDEAQDRLLTMWGCSEGQGYYYGRPAPSKRWCRT